MGAVSTDVCVALVTGQHTDADVHKHPGGTLSPNHVGPGAPGFHRGTINSDVCSARSAVVLERCCLDAYFVLVQYSDCAFYDDIHEIHGHTC